MGMGMGRGTEAVGEDGAHVGGGDGICKVR